MLSTNEDPLWNSTSWPIKSFTNFAVWINVSDQFGELIINSIVSFIGDVISTLPATDFKFSGVRSSTLILFPNFCAKAFTKLCADSCWFVWAAPPPEPLPPPNSDVFLSFEVEIWLPSESISVTPLLGISFFKAWIASSLLFTVKVPPVSNSNSSPFWIFFIKISIRDSPVLELVFCNSFGVKGVSFI